MSMRQNDLGFASSVTIAAARITAAWVTAMIRSSLTAVLSSQPVILVSKCATELAGGGPAMLALRTGAMLITTAVFNPSFDDHHAMISAPAPTMARFARSSPPRVIRLPALNPVTGVCS